MAWRGVISGRVERYLPIIIGAFIGICGSAWMLYLNSDNPRQLVIAKESLDFGEVVETDEFLWPIKIYNNSNDKLEILDFRTSCSCTSIIPSQLSIDPNGFAECHAKLDLTAVSSCQAKGDEVVRSVMVEVEPVLASSSCQPAVAARSTKFIIRGAVLPILHFSVNLIDVGSVKEGDAISATMNVESNIPLSDLSEFSAQTDSPDWSCSATPTGHHGYRLTIARTAYLPPGPFRLKAKLRLKTKDSDRPILYSKEVRGTVLAEFTASPPGLMLGRCTIGAKATEVVSISSPDGKPFEVLRVSVDPSQETAVRLRAGAHSKKAVYEIEQTASCLGVQSRQATFHILTQDQKQRTLIVPIVYVGIDP